MAVIHSDGLDGMSLEQIAQIPRNVKADMLRAEAAVIVQAQHDLALSTFSKSGTTADSAAAESPIVTGSGGYIVTSFDGVRARKTPTRNAEIAYLNNYGVKNRNKATHFIDKANEQSSEEAANAAADVLFEWQNRQLR